MDDYIKRKDVIDMFVTSDKGFCDSCCGSSDCGGFAGEYGFSIETIKEVVNAIPASDVAEVVFCKDCKYLNDILPEKTGYCGVCQIFNDINKLVYENDYCSWGDKEINKCIK